MQQFGLTKGESRPYWIRSLLSSTVKRCRVSKRLAGLHRYIKKYCAFASLRLFYPSKTHESAEINVRCVTARQTASNYRTARRVPSVRST